MVWFFVLMFCLLFCIEVVCRLPARGVCPRGPGRERLIPFTMGGCPNASFEIRIVGGVSGGSGKTKTSHARSGAGIGCTLAASCGFPVNEAMACIASRARAFIVRIGFFMGLVFNWFLVWESRRLGGRSGVVKG